MVHTTPLALGVARGCVRRCGAGPALGSAHDAGRGEDRARLGQRSRSGCRASRRSTGVGDREAASGVVDDSAVVTTHRLGLRVRLDLRDNLQRVLYCTGTYEPQVLAHLTHTLQPGGVFADVGAHIGIHSLVAARRLRQLGGGRVFAFEPTPDSAAHIRRAAARNGLDITVIERALGTRSGQVALFGSDAYSDADTGVRSQYGMGPYLGTFPVVAFDAWAAEVGLDRLDAVKIDVEGAEAAVIEGMRNSLRDLRPRLVIVETKHQAAGSASVREHLAALGYHRLGAALFGNEIFANDR